MHQNITHRNGQKNQQKDSVKNVPIHVNSFHADLVLDHGILIVLVNHYY